MNIRRLAIDALAVLTGQSALVAAQAIFVAIGARNYGAQSMGLWLMLYTLPSFLATSDLGIVTTATNEVQVALRSGDRKTAAALLVGASRTLATICIAVLLIAIGILYFPTALSQGALTSFFGTNEVALLCAVFIAEFFYSSIGSVFSASGRAVGKLAHVHLLTNFARLSQTLALIAGATISIPLVENYVVSSAIRIAATLPLLTTNWRLGEWRLDELRNSQGVGSRELIKKSGGALLVTAANALHFQGILVAFGVAFGPTAVLILYAIKTLSRVPTVVVNSIAFAAVPQLVTAMANSAAPQLRTSLVSLFSLVAAIASGSAATFILFGNQALSIWTGTDATQLTLPQILWAALDMISMCLQAALAYSLISLRAAKLYGLVSLFLYGGLYALLQQGVIASLAAGLAGIGITNALIAVLGLAILRLRLEKQ